MHEPVANHCFSIITQVIKEMPKPRTNERVKFDLLLTSINEQLRALIQICPGLNANQTQIPYDKHHKVSSLVKRHQNTHSSVKYEVI